MGGLPGLGRQQETWEFGTTRRQLLAGGGPAALSAARIIELTAEQQGATEGESAGVEHPRW